MKYLHDKIPDRHCGACTECCSALAVAELEKPLWEPCKHLCPKGCAIYESKPDECTQFECMWLRGFFGADKHRPDKLGLVVCQVAPNRLDLSKSVVAFLERRHWEREQAQGLEHKPVKVIAIWESRPLALSNEKPRYILGLLRESYNVCVLRYLEKREWEMYGPDLDDLRKETEKRLASGPTQMLELRDLRTDAD